MFKIHFDRDIVPWREEFSGSTGGCLPRIRECLCRSTTFSDEVLDNIVSMMFVSLTGTTDILQRW